MRRIFLGVVCGVGNQIGVGKESGTCLKIECKCERPFLDVYMVKDKDGQEYAMKIHRLATLSHS